MGAKQDKQLEAARELVRSVAERFDFNAWARLWDGTRLPLGKAPTSNFEISISDPGVIGAIVRNPRLDTIIRQYIEKGLDFSGGTLIDLGRNLQTDNKSPKFRARDIASVGRNLLPFFFSKKRVAQDAYGFGGDFEGTHRKTADNKDYIHFHYDLSND
ncbi:MAG TPA: SAM-dependent methyltransferase, partial [Hyphomicrobium sp.]|nr:SAM-dependent methyltransferase [Hyphomicrobium sp.]